MFPTFWAVIRESEYFGNALFTNGLKNQAFQRLKLNKLIFFQLLKQVVSIKVHSKVRVFNLPCINTLQGYATPESLK